MCPLPSFCHTVRQRVRQREHVIACSVGTETGPIPIPNLPNLSNPCGFIIISLSLSNFL